jgi:hypothetical protein
MRISDISKFDPETPWLEYINNILTPEIIQVGEKRRFRIFQCQSGKKIMPSSL